MAWLGIWFEHEAGEGGARNPQEFRGLVPPVVYPYARGFVEAEDERLGKSADPGIMVREGERFRVYYSLAHDGEEGGLDRQGCRILRWLFETFSPGSSRAVSLRFSEVPVVIHEAEPARAAALGNALTLLRFLGAREDQVVAKIQLHPWLPVGAADPRGTRNYEQRVTEFLHGEIYYRDEVSLFDVLERRDLRAHRRLPPCCQEQIGFVTPLLEWIDDCWPATEQGRRDLAEQLRNSLADEARYRRACSLRTGPPTGQLPTSFR